MTAIDRAQAEHIIERLDDIAAEEATDGYAVYPAGSDAWRVAMEFLADALAQVRAQVVAAERERCLKCTDGFLTPHPTIADPWYQTGRFDAANEIARRIEGGV